jgi:LysM repeat protein
MQGTRTERLRAFARDRIVGGLMPLRRHVMTATALLFVLSVVLLGLDALLPFPSPSDRMLYDPTDWSLLFPREGGGTAPEASAILPGPSVGGAAAAQPPVTILLYKVKPGDTMGDIAIKLGMNLDTISSMNRVSGRGVHTVIVGETLKIPSQDGIVLTVSGDFDALCEKNEKLPEDVLAANSLTRDDLKQGMKLFFPGVQNKGYALLLSVGVGVSMPLRGWETDAFGRRKDPFTGAPSYHYGVDIAAAEGSRITSATDGYVTAAGWDDAYGNYVAIQAPMHYSYIYGHMSKILPHAGARVSTG